MANKIVYKGYNVGETTQVSIMPTATADNSGAIVQYVGATNANYINGYFYKCVSDGGVTPAYSWEKIQVSDGGDTIAVINSPITKVGTAINGDRFWSKRTGNVVEIMIDGTTGSNIPCAQSVVVAKVPKNALTISDVCIEIDSKSLVSAPESGHKRAWVDSTGNVCVFIVMPDLAATYTGNIYIGGTYITAE